MGKIKLIIVASLILTISCKKNSDEPSEQTELVRTMKYRVEIIPTWNPQSPAWPDVGGHFSWIGGATHNATVKFWEVGTLASPGIDLMSVTGFTTDLVSEIQIEIANGSAENLINEEHWFCPDENTSPNCGELSFEIIVSKEFPLVTLASMLGPSPDWFIGVESLSMVDGNGTFIPQITNELYPYDAGILSDNSVLGADCCDREPLSEPQENIHLITTESGEAIGPSSLGQIIFTAIPDSNN
ncbi:MAG: spondin domain-containing protein [Aurantibacter sp.]